MKSDNERAFRELLKQHVGILNKVAGTYCKNESDRRDLIQEMLIQIWKSMPKYNAQFAVSTWLYRIALNTAISFYRKNQALRRNQVAMNDPVANTIQETTSDPEHERQLQLLEQFIHELNDLDKALMLLYLEGKSHAEIAEILGISTSNVSTKIGRIKEKLKIRFSPFNT